MMRADRRLAAYQSLGALPASFSEELEHLFCRLAFPRSNLGKDVRRGADGERARYHANLHHHALDRGTHRLAGLALEPLESRIECPRDLHRAIRRFAEADRRERPAFFGAGG